MGTAVFIIVQPIGAEIKSDLDELMDDSSIPDPSAVGLCFPARLGIKGFRIDSGTFLRRGKEFASSGEEKEDPSGEEKEIFHNVDPDKKDTAKALKLLQYQIA